jgi:hypothetical protein
MTISVSKGDFVSSTSMSCSLTQTTTLHNCSADLVATIEFEYIRTTTLDLNINSLQIPWVKGATYSVSLPEGFTSDGTQASPDDQISIVVPSTDPSILSSIPAAGSTNSLQNTSIVITFDRDILLSTGKVYLYNASNTLLATYPTNKSIKSSKNKIVLDVRGVLNANTTYYIKTDTNWVIDHWGFACPQITSSSTLSWTTAPQPDWWDLSSAMNFSLNANTVPNSYKFISNVPSSFNYSSNEGNLLFGVTIPVIPSPITSDQFTIILSCPNGKFVSGGLNTTGTDFQSGSTWSYTGNPAAVNAKFSQIVFLPTKDYIGTTSVSMVVTKAGSAYSYSTTISLIHTNSFVKKFYLLTNTSGTWTPSFIDLYYGYIADIGLVGGGGGGRGSTQNYIYVQGSQAGGGGGGGGGVIILSNITISNQAYTYSVGSGGIYAGGTSGNAGSGGNTSMLGYTAYGGAGATYSAAGASGSPTSHAGGAVNSNGVIGGGGGSRTAAPDAYSYNWAPGGSGLVCEPITQSTLRYNDGIGAGGQGNAYYVYGPGTTSILNNVYPYEYGHGGWGSANNTRPGSDGSPGAIGIKLHL